MRVLFAVFVLSALAAVAVSQENEQFSSFLEFTKKFGKSYESLEEFVSRYQVFVENLGRIQQLREQHESTTGLSGVGVFDVTKFADLTPEEFKATYLGYVPKATDRSNITVYPNIVGLQAPVQVDWRTTPGIVSAVKDQGQCGSCWAFSATEEIESSWAMQGNSPVVLSEQQIVSCDTVDGGCNGGDTITAYQYVQGTGGIESESSYPYSSGGGDTGSCHYSASKRVVNIKSYSYATPSCTDSCNNQDETKLAASLATAGPVSICVDAEPWQFYSSGVLSSGCPHGYSDLDHCVQLVGYNQAASTPYWIIRNSWNTDWGIDGYIYVKMGSNLCGVADEATLLVTEKA